ncbi:MAG: MBL fold metallo-hydrolase [Cytophagales bacterium]|nr:MBL fold metallo-hydrolase [Cytophagales bacterium]
MLLFLLLTVGLLTGSVVLFMQFAPQFGAPPAGQHLEQLKKSQNYGSDQFKNLVTTEMNMSIGQMTGTMYQWLFEDNGKAPKKPLPTRLAEPHQEDHDSITQVTWFGHSAILLEIDGKNLLIDPMFGPAAAPVSFLSKRFPYQQAIDLENLPEIDAIIISHDHYDHLDYPSIRYLKDKTNHFFVPLGVGSHLKEWGVEVSKINELDWWESFSFEGLALVATPARHFSGRKFNDRNKTLWASWVICGNKHKIFFSGDGGYFNGFKEIGTKYGPFDFTMIECGQYNENWAAIHMMPEQSVQAHLDVQGKVMMPIHWGAFSLSLHSWKEPVERLLKKAGEENVTACFPIIGQPLDIESPPATANYWWVSHE